MHPIYPDRFKDPAKVAAGRARRPWSPQDKERLREQCRQRQPWLWATGPKTPAGKARSARNGAKGKLDPSDVRDLRRQAAEVSDWLAELAAARKAVGL